MGHLFLTMLVSMFVGSEFSEFSEEAALSPGTLVVTFRDYVRDYVCNVAIDSL